MASRPVEVAQTSGIWAVHLRDVGQYGELMPLDAIVVLGCRISPSGRPSSAAVRRASRAAEAWRAGQAPLVVASGGRRWHGVAEAQALTRYLVDRGVAKEAIVAEWCSLSTAENAWYVARLLERLGKTRIGVVTCDWHLPRALAAFEAEGLFCEPIPVSSSGRSLGSRSWCRLTEAVRRRYTRPVGLRPDCG